MDILDRAKAVTGSDNKTAQYLGISQGRIADIRGGTKNITPYMAAMLAELLGERWSDELPAILEQNARTPAERKYWQGKLQRLGTAAALVVAIVLGGNIQRSYSAGFPSTGQIADAGKVYKLYIMRHLSPGGGGV